MVCMYECMYVRMYVHVYHGMCAAAARSRTILVTTTHQQQQQQQQHDDNDDDMMVTVLSLLRGKRQRNQVALQSGVECSLGLLSKAVIVPRGRQQRLRN